MTDLGLGIGIRSTLDYRDVHVYCFCLILFTMNQVNLQDPPPEITTYKKERTGGFDGWIQRRVPKVTEKGVIFIRIFVMEISSLFSFSLLYQTLFFFWILQSGRQGQ